MIKIKETKALNELSSSIEHYDMLICCASFEERCLAIAESINKELIDSVLICQYDDPAHLSSENQKKLTCLLQKNANVVSLDKDAPLFNYDALHDAILAKKPQSILLDISTFTRETILIALMLFKQEPFKNMKVTLGYVPADRYSSATQGDINDIWLSRGVSDIRTVLGYSGSYSSLKKTLLIVLVGFEVERANILISNFEADKLYLGYVPPTESFSEELSKVSEENFSRLISIVGSCNTFEFSCRNLQQTYDALKEIIEVNKNEYNIVISPMNNKLSTLSVASVVFEYPEVQVCYASTNQYNTEAYSSPGDKVMLFDFSNTEEA